VVARDDAAVAIADAAEDSSLALAPKWIGRRYVAGAGAIQPTLDTFTLQHDQGRMLFTVEGRRAPKTTADGDEPEGWQLVGTSKHTGTIVESDDLVRLSFPSGGRQFDMTCKRTTVAAARADAVRAPTPNWRRDHCEDRGRWVPAGTQPVDVIRCIPFDDSGSGLYGGYSLALAAAPGIESLYVIDDGCMGGRGGWRLMPSDGSIAKTRQ
jgi:hypothetical protein